MKKLLKQHTLAVTSPVVLILLTETIVIKIPLQRVYKHPFAILVHRPEQLWIDLPISNRHVPDHAFLAFAHARDIARQRSA